MPAAPFIVAIPARMASTRLPGKPLAAIGGVPMIVHVARRALASGAVDVVVATDDARIADALRESGVNVAMTRADHASGSDRLAECAEMHAWPDDTIVVNPQGDEPLAPASGIRTVAAALDESGAPMGRVAFGVPSGALEAVDEGALHTVGAGSTSVLYRSKHMGIFRWCDRRVPGWPV